MERVKRKKIPISRRIIASLLAVFMAVTAIITGMSPVTAKADGSNYTLISLGEERWYDDVFSGYDDSMGHWKTYHFTVQDDYGNEYEAICVEPHKDTPRESETFTATKEYGTDDIEARVMFWAVGAGWDDEEWGVLKDYPYELRWIIAHHTIALANGQDDWNTPLNGNGTFLGDGEGKLGWELCQKLLSIAANISPSSVGYECSLTYLSNDSKVNQSLGVYNDTPVKELTGSVRFNKESAMPSISDGNSCYSLAGAEISIYSDADCTDLLDTLTTGEDGYTDYYSTTFREGDSVTLYFKETKAPKGFFINDEVRSITLDSEDSYTETITDMPGSDPITLLLKKQTADGHGSGDTRLEGAEYTVKYYDILSDTDPAIAGNEAKYTWIFKTDENGRIILTDDYLVSGSDGLIVNIAGGFTLPLGTITIQETKAPEGYLLNDTIYVAQTKLDTNTVVTSNLPTDDNAAQETPYEGTISIQKFLGGGSTVKTSEPDAEFEIYLTSAGSYDAAPEESRQTITTDANGYAITKRLPYGTYTVHQTKGNNKYYFVDDMEITISENNANYHKILEDSPIEFYIKMVKKDASTGNTVNVAGTTFELYDDNGSKISFNIMTSSGMQTIDSFTTDENGCVYTTEKLLKGNYTLVETKAPDGYVLDSTPVQFTVSEDTYTADGGAEFILVEKSDKAVTGQLTVTKVGEVLDEYKGGLYVNPDEKGFTYREGSLSGAKFEVYAAEDIYTADNQKDTAGNRNKHYSKGELVTTLVTGTDGKATATNLPLGKYKVVEVEAPDGFVLNPDEQVVTLVYVDDKTPVVNEALTFSNDRQKVELSVSKLDSETRKPVEGAVFGLFTKEDIVNADGKVIVNADTQIEKAVTGKDGKVTFTSDLPLGQYYVKELEAPAGYVKSDKVIDVDATYKGDNVKVIELEAAFENIPIKVEFSKTDITGEKELPGAKLSVIDSEGKIVESWISEAGKSHVIERLPVGKYTLREESAPYGYKVAVDVTFEITETSEIQKVIMKDEQAVGRIIINKTDSVTGSPIEGVVFEIRDKDGKVLDTLTTDKNGYAESKLLPICTYNKDGSYKEDIHYTVIETKATNGYILDETSYDVVLKYSDNAPVCIEETVKLTNTPKPDIPKTGDTGNVYRYALLALISLAVMVSLVMAKKSRNQKN